MQLQENRIFFQPRGTWALLAVVLGLIAGSTTLEFVFQVKCRGQFFSIAINDLRAIKSAQDVCIARHPERRYARSLQELSDLGLVSSLLWEGKKEGYLFHMKSTAPDKFEAIAEPNEKNRFAPWFFVDHTGRIRYEIGMRPIAKSRALGIKH